MYNHICKNRRFSLFKQSGSRLLVLHLYDVQLVQVDFHTGNVAFSVRNLCLLAQLVLVGAPQMGALFLPGALN